jgi:hypothetical protein
MDEPKTRREKKGRDKTKTNTVYSAKHVREHERLQEKKQQAGGRGEAKGEKTIKK